MCNDVLKQKDAYKRYFFLIFMLQQMKWGIIMRDFTGPRYKVFEIKRQLELRQLFLSFLFFLSSRNAKIFLIIRDFLRDS